MEAGALLGVTKDRRLVTVPHRFLADRGRQRLDVMSAGGNPEWVPRPRWLGHQDGEPGCPRPIAPLNSWHDLRPAGPLAPRSRIQARESQPSAESGPLF